MYDWLNERLLIASEETYRDLSNIQGKVMKHRAFEAEMQANKERLDNICEVSWDGVMYPLLHSGQTYCARAIPAKTATAFKRLKFVKISSFKAKLKTVSLSARNLVCQWLHFL